VLGLKETAAKRPDIRYDKSDAQFARFPMNAVRDAIEALKGCDHVEICLQSPKALRLSGGPRNGDDDTYIAVYISPIIDHPDNDMKKEPIVFDDGGIDVWKYPPETKMKNTSE